MGGSRWWLAKVQAAGLQVLAVAGAAVRAAGAAVRQVPIATLAQVPIAHAASRFPLQPSQHARTHARTHAHTPCPPATYLQSAPTSDSTLSSAGMICLVM